MYPTSLSPSRSFQAKPLQPAFGGWKLFRRNVNPRQSDMFEKKAYVPGDILREKANVLQALDNGSLTTLTSMFARNPGYVNTVRDKLNNTLLHLAVRKRDIRLLRFLLAYKPDPNIRNSLQRSPLHEAMGDPPPRNPDFLPVTPDPRIVEALLAGGADPALTNNGDENAFHLAAGQARNIFLQLVLGLNPRREGINLAHKGGPRPLHMAAKTGHPQSVQMLLFQPGVGVDDVIDCNQETALHIATREKRPDIVALLLKAGANPNAAMKGGCTPLLLALTTYPQTSVETMDDIFRQLLNAGANPIVMTDSQESILTAAAHHPATSQFTQAVLEFYKKHDRLDLLEYKDSQDYTAVMKAAQSGHPDSVRLLVEAGADIHQLVTFRAGAEGRNLLHLAAENPNPQVLKYLMSLKQFNVNQTFGHNSTALSQALSKGFEEHIRLLHTEGANLDAPDYRGDGSLLQAMTLQRQALIPLLLELGANVNAASTLNGFTPLSVAVSAKDIPLIKNLLAHGAIVNTEDIHKITPLHMAVGGFMPEIVQMLLDAGSNPDAVNGEGQKPEELLDLVNSSWMDAQMAAFAKQRIREIFQQKRDTIA